MYSIVFLGLVSCIFSLFLTPFVRDLFLKAGLVDRPSDRKLHLNPVPRVGGIAIFLSFVLSFAALFLVRLRAGYLIRGGLGEALQILPAIAIVFATGLADDLWGLKPWQKMLGQLAGIGVACWAGVRIAMIAYHPIPGWASIPLTILWLLGCTNAVNLIDGVDGLAAGVGAFATITMLLAAFLQHNVPLALATVPLAGALIGFLRYNFNPATIFLGDCGSLLIGFMLGCYGILWSQKSATILGMTAPLMVLAIPLLDTSIAILRRFLRRKPIFAADRGHIHHRLLDRGLTPRRVVVILYGVCALGAICSLAMMNTAFAGLVLIFFCITTCVGIQHLGYVEFGTVGRMFRDGSFRRQLTGELAVLGLVESLKSASSPDDCWVVIRDVSREFGFCEVRLRLGGQLFEDRSYASSTPCWKMNVPLSDRDFIELNREFDRTDHATAVSLFADVVRRALHPKINAFDPRISGKRAVGVGASD